MLQPVIMNIFPPEIHPDTNEGQPSASRFDNDENSLLMKIMDRAEAISNAQDKRIESHMKADSGNTSSTARALHFLQLQYDLDDMQISATLAKNIAEKVGQAITNLTSK